MRRPFIWLCFAGLVVGACDRGPETGTAGTSPTAGGRAASGIGTSGSAEARRELTPLEAAVRKTVVREVTIPSGTELPVTLDTRVGSEISRLEQPVTARLTRPIQVDGEPVLPEGSTLSGVVTDATRSAKVKGRAHLAMRFDTVTPRGGDDRYRIETAPIARTAEAETKKDALKIGGPAAGGAIIGGIVGGGKGAAIGAAAGGGAGTAVVLSTRGKEVVLPAGTALRVRLTEPLVVRIRG
jgi:hypothetical protein